MASNLLTAEKLIRQAQAAILREAIKEIRGKVIVEHPERRVISEQNLGAQNCVEVIEEMIGEVNKGEVKES